MDEISSESSVMESVVEAETQQHHTEALLHSRAINQGWPQTIDFESLKERVIDVKDALEEIIDDPGNSVFFKFFMELVQNLGKNHSMGVAGELKFSDHYGRGTG